MLEPHDRRLFLESFRPDPGFELWGAIGTTYSLDLLSLLIAPIGFSLFELDESDGRPNATAALLEALRRYASKIAVFCQSGRARISGEGHPLLAFLEGSVVEVDPGNGGVFHPKTWLLRFEHPSGDVRYRLLVASRNLTFERTWDTLVVLEGALMRGRQKAYGRNHPVGDLVAALPALATGRPAPPHALELVSRMADEVRRVDFQVPAPFEDVDFWAGGIAGSKTWPFDSRVDRALVISPFLAAGTLERLVGRAAKSALVSTSASLNEIRPAILGAFGGAYVLRDDAEEEADEAQRESGDLSGLHAKVYVLERGWEASVWTGSANATAAAFRQNVEFLVNLRGKKSACGIDTVLGPRQGQTTFGDMLDRFTPAEDWVEPPEDAIEAALEEARRALASAALEVDVVAGEDDGTYRMRLSLAAVVPLRSVVSTVCRPISIAPAHAKPLPEPGHALDFGPMGVDGITSFVAFEVRAGAGADEQVCRFVRNLPLRGAPADRSVRLLRHVLRDKAGVTQFILLLLSLDGDAMPDAGSGLGALDAARREGRESDASAGLMEQLVRCLHRSPQRLKSLEDFLDTLRASAQAEDLLPDGLLELWAAVKAAAETRTP